jgi:hypothetical protein
VHRYYQRAARELGLGSIPPRPAARPAVVVVPVAEVSRLAEYGISAALTISDDVIAVTVVKDADDRPSSREQELREQWARWNPGPPLQVLHSEYASVAGPIVAFVDRLRKQRDEEIVVLIPVAIPERLRYRFLHNHYDQVLSAALRRNLPDVRTARVSMPLH